MSEQYAGHQIIGMDLHRRRSVLVRTAQTGEQLETVRISNDPSYLQAVMGRAGEAPDVVLEAAYGWLVTVVTDAGAVPLVPVRGLHRHPPELRHVRTRVRTPGQNGSRERGFGTLKYEWLFLEEIDDVLDLTLHAEGYRVDYNTVRPHEALAWNRPRDVHSGLADPNIPNFPEPEILPTA